MVEAPRMAVVTTKTKTKTRAVVLPEATTVVLLEATTVALLAATTADIPEVITAEAMTARAPTIMVGIITSNEKIFIANKFYKTKQ